MKKSIFSQLFLAAAMLGSMSLSTASCSSDDDSNSLTGTWVTENRWEDGSSYKGTYVFRGNGTGNHQEEYNDRNDRKNSYTTDEDFKYSIIYELEGTNSGEVRIVFTSGNNTGSSRDLEYSVGGDVLRLNGTSYNRK